MNFLRTLGRGARYILAFSLLTIVFGSAFYLAWNAQVPEATLMAGLFILLLIALNFPGIDTFKAFGLEVKRIQDTLKEAQATLEQLKQLAASSAQSQYYQLSSAGRWDAGDIGPKHRLASDLSKYLKEINVDSAKIVDVQQPYIDMLRTDFFHIIRDIVQTQHSANIAPVLGAYNAIKPRFLDGVNMFEEDQKPFKTQIENSATTIVYVGHGVPTESHFYDVVQAQIFKDKFGEELSAPLYAVMFNIKRVYNETKEAGNLTEEGFDLLKRFGQYNHEPTKISKLMESKYARR